MAHDPIDTAERIERDYQAAMRVIRRQRPFQIEPWGQKLPGATEQRIAGRMGNNNRDNGVLAKVRA